MSFWWRLPLSVIAGSLAGALTYIGEVMFSSGFSYFGNWSVVGGTVVFMVAVCGTLILTIVVPVTILLKLLKTNSLTACLLISLLCIGINVYLHVVQFRMAIDGHPLRYIFEATSTGLIGGLAYVAVQYLAWRSRNDAFEATRT